MIKRTVSSILAASFLMTAASFNVEAAGTLSMKKFNSTTSGVIIDFDGLSEGAYISKSTVKDNIVLEKHQKDGSIVEITDYEIVVQKKSYDSSTGAEKANKTNSVIIKPTDGISDEAMYRLTIKEGLSDSEGNKMAETVNSGWFGVDVLFYDTFDEPAEPFEYPYVLNSDGKLTRAYYNSNNWGRVYFSDNNGGYGSKYNQKGTMQFGDDVSVWLNKNAFEEAESLKDYTVEFEYKYPGYHNETFVTSMRAQTTPSHYAADTVCRVELGGTAAKGGAVSLKYKDWGTLAKIDSFIPESNIVDIRMSAIGDNVQYFIDDDKLFDIDGIKDVAGKTLFRERCSGFSWANPSYIDNLKVTKVINYGKTLPELEIQDYSLEDDKINIKMSQMPDNESAEKFITLKKGEEVINLLIRINEEEVEISPENILDDGVYVLTINEGLCAYNSAMLKEPYQLCIEVVDGEMSITEVELPQISNLDVSVLNNKLSLKYDYSGENENNSRIFVYASNEKDGEFEEIYQNVLKETEIEFDAGEEYVDKFLKIKILPEDIKGYINSAINVELKGMFTPLLKNAEIVDRFDKGYVEVENYEFYDENDDEDLTEFKWYASDKFDGEYKEIDGAEGKKLEITDELKEKFVKAYITPKTNTYPYEGKTYISDYYTKTRKPEAENVKISGNVEMGATLTGSYDYIDHNGADESGTVIRWLYSEEKDGEYKPVEGAENNSEYVISEKDIGRFIKFEVIPKKDGVSGDSYYSEAIAMPAKPEAKNVKISGVVKVGRTVSGVYEYYQINGVKEAESEYAWYVDGDKVSDDIMYEIKKSDAGKKIYFEVTPKAEKEPVTGETVKSAEVKITAATSSKGSGGGSGSGGGGASIGFSSITNKVTETINSAQNSQDTGVITNFTDIGESIYKKEIAELYDRGIIKGVSDTEFAPTRNIKRAELVTLMVRYLGLNINKYNGVFADISGEAWYADNVQTAFDKGIVSGYAGLFRPNDAITIEEIIKILIESYEGNEEIITASEKEQENVSEWAAEYIKKASKLGIVSENEFVYNDEATREQAAVLIYRLVMKAGEK